MGLSRMPIARRRCLTIEPKTQSRLRIKYPGAESQGKASVIWRAIHSAVGLVVTPIQMMLSAIEPKDNEAIEKFKGKRRHDKQVHRCHLWHVVAQKRPPALAGRSVVPVRHVLRDSGLSDMEAELQKLSMDARCAPEGVLKAHLYDQRPQVPVDLRDALPGPGTSIASSCENLLGASARASPGRRM